MVFAVNGGLVVEGRALGARFTHAERRTEGPAYLAWLADAGLKDVTEPVHINEGGSSRCSWSTRASTTWTPRSRFLDDRTVAYFPEAFFPEAFSPGSRGVLQRLFPDAILASEADALVLGLNAVSDGLHVVLPSVAEGLAAQLPSCASAATCRSAWT